MQQNSAMPAAGLLPGVTAQGTPLAPPPACRPLSCQTAQAGAGSLRPPSVEECYALWDRYAMPQHIREHSRLVADIALYIALRARDLLLYDCVQSVRASALLHDLAKHYTIEYGGNHAQLGGVWALEATGSPVIAQGVVHHVYWPWHLDVDAYFLPLCVIYADKRVRHDTFVTIEERFEDLFERYATNDFIRGRIELSKQQALEVERALSNRLGIDLHACTFAVGGLVE